MGYYIAVPGQSFEDFNDWVECAKARLTRHPEYNDTEHSTAEPWRGYHFKALCFDQLGRRCRQGADFMRARDEGTYPIWYIWPDQIAELLMTGRVK